MKIVVGMVYTYIGLVLFLTGVNVGFMPAGNYLGEPLQGLPYRLDPDAHRNGDRILYRQGGAGSVCAEETGRGDYGRGDLRGTPWRWRCLYGVSASVGLAMIRVLTGISIFWFYPSGLCRWRWCLSFFVPKIFTAIAFDSGGVASGPMTATFLLPFAMGACAGGGRQYC